MRDLTGVTYLLLINAIQNTEPTVGFLRSCAGLLPNIKNFHDATTSSNSSSSEEKTMRLLEFFEAGIENPAYDDDFHPEKEKQKGVKEAEAGDKKAPNKEVLNKEAQDEIIQNENNGHAWQRLNLIKKEQKKLKDEYDVFIQRFGGTLAFWQESETLIQALTNENSNAALSLYEKLRFSKAWWTTLRKEKLLQGLFLPSTTKISGGVKELMRLDLRADSLQKMTQSVFSDLSHRRRTEHTKKDDQRAYGRTQLYLTKAKKSLEEAQQEGLRGSEMIQFHDTLQAWLETVLNGMNPEWPHKKCLMHFLDQQDENDLTPILDKKTTPEGIRALSLKASVWNNKTFCFCKKKQN